MLCVFIVSGSCLASVLLWVIYQLPLTELCFLRLFHFSISEQDLPGMELEDCFFLYWLDGCVCKTRHRNYTMRIDMVTSLWDCIFKKCSRGEIRKKRPLELGGNLLHDFLSTMLLVRQNSARISCMFRKVQVPGMFSLSSLTSTELVLFVLPPTLIFYCTWWVSSLLAHVVFLFFVCLEQRSFSPPSLARLLHVTH